mgnify:CR=1 FL=1
MNVNSSLVSVIITCYNQGRFLPESLDSLLAQTYLYWECIIVDDGSTDNTADVAKVYSSKDRRVSYVYQQNKGVSEARNLGISKSQGEFIQFLDADDLLHPEKIKAQSEILQSNEKIDLVYGCSRFFIDGEPEVLYPFRFRGGGIPCDLSYRDEFQVEMLFKHNITTNCSLLMRSKVLRKVNFRDVIFEDWVFNFECSLNGFIFHFDNSFSAYTYIRITNSSLMERHIKQVIEIKNFKSYLLGLAKEYKYPFSKLHAKNEKKKLSKDMIKLIKQVTPPVFYPVYSFLKRQLFK